MKCQNCGTDNREETAFCTSCGAKIEAGAADESKNKKTKEKTTKSIVMSWITVTILLMGGAGVAIGLFTMGGVLSPIASGLLMLGVTLGGFIYTVVICKRYARPSFVIAIINGSISLSGLLVILIFPMAALYIGKFSASLTPLGVITPVLMTAGGAAALSGRREAWMVLSGALAASIAESVRILSIWQPILTSGSSAHNFGAIVGFLLPTILAHLPLIFIIINAKKIGSAHADGAVSHHAAARSFCKKCGAKLAPDDLFCSNCGAPLRSHRESIII